MPAKKAAKVEPVKVEVEAKPVKPSKPAPPDEVPAAGEYDQFRHANHSHLNP